MRGFIDAAMHWRWEIFVPTPVLTEVWHGGRRQREIALLLARCMLEPLDEHLARQADDLGTIRVRGV